MGSQIRAYVFSLNGDLRESRFSGRKPKACYNRSQRLSARSGARYHRNLALRKRIPEGFHLGTAPAGVGFKTSKEPRSKLRGICRVARTTCLSGCASAASRAHRRPPKYSRTNRLPPVTFGHPDNKLSEPPEKGKPKQASGNSTQEIKSGDSRSSRSARRRMITGRL